jgi:predicted nucleotidyltransferase
VQNELSENILRQAGANGFPYRSEMVNLFIGGSGLHGGRVDGKNDDDFYGVFVEPPEMVVSGMQSYPHYVWGTSSSNERNRPGDVDIVFYGLKKWAAMAAGGNPTALGFLSAPNLAPTACWARIQASGLFAAKTHSSSFERFASQQLDRVTGVRGRGKHGQRPELEEKYGYDTKAAMHVIRLLSEGIEYMRTGRITYPRPERHLLIDIRLGKFGMEDIKGMAEPMFGELERARADSPLPERTDAGAVSALVTDCYMQHWGAAPRMTRAFSDAFQLACMWIANSDKPEEWASWNNKDAVMREILGVVADAQGREK